MESSQNGSFLYFIYDRSHLHFGVKSRYCRIYNFLAVFIYCFFSVLSTLQFKSHSPFTHTHSYSHSIHSTFQSPLLAQQSEVIWVRILPKDTSKGRQKDTGDWTTNHLVSGQPSFTSWATSAWSILRKTNDMKRCVRFQEILNTSQLFSLRKMAWK